MTSSIGPAPEGGSSFKIDIRVGDTSYSVSTKYAKLASFIKGHSGALSLAGIHVDVKTVVQKKPQDLAKLLEEKGYTTNEVRQAVDRILNEPHLRLIAESEWGDKTVADLLQEPGNKPFFEALLALKTAYPERTGNDTHVDACYKDIQIFLLSHITRNPKKVGAATQRFMQGSATRTEFVYDKGFPSEQDKGAYRRQIEAHNTNLGAVVSDHVITMRSGKSDSLSRLQELATAACMEELKSQHPHGFDGNEFRLVITSYLDQSTLKALPERIRGMQDEAKAFAEIVKASEKWQDFTITVDGKTITIKQPIIHNQLFSTTVRGVGTGVRRLCMMGQKRADVSNERANEFLARRYFSRLGIEPDNVQDFLKERASTDIVAKSLYVTLFRRLPNSMQEIHAADLAIYKNILFQELNLSQAVQCKSGTDRTAIGVALAVAQDAFKKQYGYYFDPEIHNAPIERDKLLFFKSEFRKALKEFGVEITVETKGYYGIKWGGGVPIIGGVANPVAHKYLYHEGDRHGGRVIDVEGLDYLDISNGGLHAYKGRIRDPFGLYGKSKTSTKRQLEAIQRSLSHEDVVFALFQIENVVPRGVFNSKLQLTDHISKFKLDIPKIEQRVLELQGTQDPVEKLQLYMLQQILLLTNRA